MNGSFVRGAAGAVDDFSVVKCTYRKMKRILEGKALIHHSDSWVGRGKKPFSVDGLVLLWTLSLMEKRLCFSFGNNVCQKREKFAFLAATAVTNSAKFF